MNFGEVFISQDAAERSLASRGFVSVRRGTVGNVKPYLHGNDWILFVRRRDGAERIVQVPLNGELEMYNLSQVGQVRVINPRGA